MIKSIKSIKLGNIKLNNNLFLAPLDGFTNVAFRKCMVNLSPGLMFTEMISSKALSKDRNYCKEYIYRDKSEKILCYQLNGNNANEFIKAIQNIESDVNIININVGCPSENIISYGSGSALLTNKNKIYAIIKKIKKEFDNPLTIKTRIGFNRKRHYDYNKLYDSGCDGLIIHGRTAKQMYSGIVDLNFIKYAKEQSEIPVIGNGDIKNNKDLINMYNKSKVDGFMIGRGALNNPYIFDEILYGNYHNNQIKNKLIFIKKYYKYLIEYDFKNPFIKVKNLSMFLFKGINNAKDIRINIMKSNNYDELLAKLEVFL